MYLIGNTFSKRFTNLKAYTSLRLFRFSTTQHYRSNSEVKDGEEKDPYDIIISGGGMIGTALAAAIGHNSVLRHKRVLLLESGEELKLATAPEHFSSRVCALSHSTKQLLHSFGAWNKMLRYQKVNHMRVWDSCSDVGISFDLDSSSLSSSSSSSSSSSPLSFLSSSLSSLSELAYIVENDVILSAISNELSNTQVDVRYKCRVESYVLPQEANNDVDGTDGGFGFENCKEKYPKVVLDNGETFSAKLLIGADGSDSLLRKTANIKTIEWPYRQNAVVATVQLNEDRENNTAWQRFLKSGPIALLPLSHDHSCLIWTTSTQHSHHLLSIDPQLFVNSINHAYCDDKDINYAVSSVSQKIEEFLVSTGLGMSSTKILPPTVASVVQGSRQTFPLSLCHANHYVKSRMALVGDAAHRVHPLSGQGVNLGFGDVIELVSILQDSVLMGSDIGSVANLVRYETNRQRRVLPMMASIDLLNRFYGNDFDPLVLLRSIGCKVADSVPLVKNKMIQFAIG